MGSRPVRVQPPPGAELAHVSERAALATRIEKQLRSYVPELLLRWPIGEAWQSLDGTLVSADISGFTALSERLAAKGREGVEELTELINNCFDGMIDNCLAEGGDVLKFGGDALLVFFAGDHHSQRACRAAVAMRRTVRTPRKTAEGRGVRLGVSIGIHSGDHTFFVVRNGHDELLVTGPGATATVNAEAAATAGEILLTAQTASRLPHSWLGAATPDGVLLKRIFSVPAVTPVTPKFRKPSEFIPPEQLDQIVAKAANEHRQISISFIEFAGTDALDPGELSNRLQTLATAVWDACHRNGVFWLSTDVYSDGGKFIVTSGAPVSRGGDEDRLLRAVRAIVDADPGLKLRAGINRGYVFAGDLGSERRRTYTTMGDATNLAARLMAKAGRGEIIASRPMVDWAASNIEYEALEPFMVKGKSMPIHAGRIGRVVGRRTDLDKIDTDLCGRADELALLLARADEALAGRGSVSVITGEPGIGKSRLVLEVIRQRPGLTLAYARCQPYDRLAAYSVMEPLLRALMQIDHNLLPEPAGRAMIGWLAERAPDLLPFAPLIAVAVGAEVSSTEESDAVAAEFRRTRTLQLLVTLIQRTVTTAVAVFVDDVNLADDATRELVQALIDAARETSLLVLATSVPDETLHSDPIRLNPLSEIDVARLLDVLLGERIVAPETVRAIVNRSAGNPLFIGELVRSLAEDPHAVMPASLEALVSSRVDALEPIDRQLLRQASVLGTEVNIGVLGQVLGDRLIRRQDRWERLSRFLEWASPGVVRFRYDTYWRVVYGGLSFSARRAAHRRVIEVLEFDLDSNDSTVMTLLAAHSDRAGDVDRTWRYALSAAQSAETKAMFGEASTLYEMAFQTVPAGTDKSVLVEMSERAADVFITAGKFDRADRSLRRATSLAVGPVTLARHWRKRGDMYEQWGDIGRAERAYRTARRQWAKVDWSIGLAERARLDVSEAALAFRRGQYVRVWSLASAALTQASLLEDWVVAARAGHLVDNVVVPIRWLGSSLQRLDVRRLYQLANDRVGEARHLNNLAVDLYFEGDWSSAASLYRECAQQCSVSGNVVDEATSLNNIAEILSDQGRFVDAEEMFRTANRIWQSVGFATGIALAEANLGRLATRTGEYEKAEKFLCSSLERFDRLEARGYVDEVEIRIFENQMAAGRDVDGTQVSALRDFQSRPGLEANVVASLHRVLAHSLWTAKQISEAATEIQKSIAVARLAEIPFELAQSLAIAVQLGFGSEADNIECAAIFDRLGVGNREWVGRTIRLNA